MYVDRGTWNVRGLYSLLGLMVCSIGICFWYIYWFNLRKTGLEVFGDVIWWNDMRPVHGIMYILAGVALLSKDYKGYAWKLIVADTVVGLVKFTDYHFGTKKYT
jgi:hypothetical protein